MDYRDSDYDIMSFLEQLADPNPGQRNDFVDSLPKLREAQFMAAGHRDDRCPICQDTFLSCLALEEMAEAMDTPAMSPYDHGVTKLPKCGHIFCRKDISKWIISAKKDTCPTCRTPIGLPDPSPAHAPQQTNGASSPPQSARDADFAEAVRRMTQLYGGVNPLDTPGENRQTNADLLARLTGQLNGHGESLNGNLGDSPYQHDDRSEYSSMYS